MDLRTKHQLKSGQALELVRAPDSAVALFSNMGTECGGDIAAALLVFVIKEKALEKQATMIVRAAASDRLTWVAYPKSGLLGTDLDRDKVAAFLRDGGAQPVRQVAIDDLWSALRFRPG